MASPLELQELVRRRLPEVVALRRQLHQFPELSGQEQRTAAAVAQQLSASGLCVRTAVGGHGVVARLGSEGPCLALRADMDALPVQEQTTVPWRSQTPGVMHACGHDFHTAWLVGTALVLRDLGLPRGCVKFLFQPAEEALYGAQNMIAAGALDDPPVAAIVGAHVWPEDCSDVVGLRPGHNLAAADRFHVTVTGTGTHGATPHRGRDPIPVVAEIVTALQTLVTRRLNPLSPAVVSVCQLQAGTAFNIIAPSAELTGTVRTVSADDRQQVQRNLEALCVGIAQAHGLEATVDYEWGVPPTVTDPVLTARATSALREVLSTPEAVVEAQPSMGAEDFAFYLEHCPGVLLWIGCAPDPDSALHLSLHDPCFVGDEGCLETAMLSLAAVALNYLSG